MLVVFAFPLASRLVFILRIYICSSGICEKGCHILNFAMETFQGGVTRLAGFGFVIHQILAKFTLEVTLHHY